MADDFLAQLVGNTVRAKLLRIFIFDQSGVYTLSRAAKRSGISLPAAAKEIKQLEKWGILKSVKVAITLPNTKRIVGGNQREKAWTFNQSFQWAAPLARFVHEVSPLRYKDLLSTLRRTGRFSVVILSGSFMGDGMRPVDLLVVADRLDERKLEQAVRALEPKLGREIRYAIFSTPEFRYRLTIQDRLLRETLDYPHHILLDKTRLL